MVLEERRNDVSAADFLHGEAVRHRRLPLRPLVVEKWRRLHDSSRLRAKGSARGGDHVLAPSEEPPPGAHLVTPRVGYLHHGIYLGAGKVIHSGAVSGLLPRGPVEEVSLESFGRGRRVRVRSDLSVRFSAQEVIDRARSRLGEDQYHLLRNNCEHLCEWCLRGRHRSYQVERLTRWLRPWEPVNRKYKRDHARPSVSRRSSTKVCMPRRNEPLDSDIHHRPADRISAGVLT